MPDTIHISYKWDRENFEKLFASSYAYQFNHSAKRYIGWLFIALLQLGVVAALKKDSIGLLLFSTIALFYWYYGKKKIAWLRAGRSFERSPFKNETIQIDVSKEGFVIRSQKSTTRWSWDEVDEVASLGDDIILYKHPYAHYIPSSGFSSVEEKSYFKTMAKRYKSTLKG